MLWMMIDLTYSTFAPRGSGYISGSVTRGTWYFFKTASKVLPGSGILNAAGISIVLANLLVWLLLLWIGSILLFVSSPMAVVNSTTHVPATTPQRIYYTGYVLSTLGNGDFKGGTNLWLIASALLSFSGILTITTAITYMVPVLTAVTSRRALSIRLAAIGNSPQDMLLKNWNGKDFSMLNSQLQELALSIAMQGQLHLAYPVLHFFYHSNKETDLLPNLVAFDEAISILLVYVPEEKRPGIQYLKPVRNAISTFLESLSSTMLEPTQGDIPPFELSELKKANIPLLTPPENHVRQLDYRRHLLESMLLNDNWTWEDLSKPALDSRFDLSAIS